MLAITERHMRGPPTGVPYWLPNDLLKIYTT